MLSTQLTNASHIVAGFAVRATLLTAIWTITDDNRVLPKSNAVWTATTVASESCNYVAHTSRCRAVNRRKTVCLRGCNANRRRCPGLRSQLENAAFYPLITKC